MEAHEIILIAFIFILLLCSAFFSSSETALTAASRAKMHQKAKQGNKKAATVNHLRQNSETLLGALLLGNNLVNILATALTTAVLTGAFGETGVAYATILMTIVVLVFAEVIPKGYAINNADSLALVLAPVVRFWCYITRPLTWLLLHFTRAIMQLGGLQQKTEIGRYLSDEELRGAIDMAGDDEETKQEKAMLHSILDLGDVAVSRIMTHRSKVTMFNIEAPTEELIEDILASPYTRIPLWREDPANIVAVIHAKALLRALHKQADMTAVDIAGLASEPWFIPETADLLSQLHAFRARREHFAIVVDEYGSLKGIVTLEDILEEIVGEIDDEHDAPVTGVRRQNDGSFFVQGTVAVRDLNRELNWNLPEDPAATIAGFVLHEARQIPEVGQIFVFHDFRFEILRRQRHQVTLLKVIPPKNQIEATKKENL